jgi:predicted nucleic-acid-binding Zn-ribbon protein
MENDTDQSSNPIPWRFYRMSDIEQKLETAFICAKCKSHGGHVEKLAMSGTGLSRLMEIQSYRYAFVSCNNCGYTEVYNLKKLEGKDKLGNILEILFAD